MLTGLAKRTWIPRLTSLSSWQSTIVSKCLIFRNSPSVDFQEGFSPYIDAVIEITIKVVCVRLAACVASSR